MPYTVGPFSLNGWRKVVGRKRQYSYSSRSTLRRCRIPRRLMRRRRTSLETRLAAKPGRKKNPSRHPLGVGRALLWPEGLTSAQASEWWAKIWSQMQAVKASRRSRPARANLRAGRQLLEAQAGGPSPLAAKLPPVSGPCCSAGSSFRTETTATRSLGARVAIHAEATQTV